VFMRMFKQSLSEGRKQVPVSEWFKLVSSIVEVAGAKRDYSIIPYLLARSTIGDRSLAGVRGSHTQVESPNYATIGLAKQVNRIANTS